MGSILVTYASKYGSTQEIAEKVREVLLKAGLKADICPVSQVKNLGTYSAVIIGSSIYVGQWHKDAVKFLQNNESMLSDKKVWIFSSGPTGKGDPAKLIDGESVPPTLKPVIDRIKPRDNVLFHGFINPEKINVVEKWAVTKIVKKPLGDSRDWKMITSWANSIAKTLKTK